jgi:hypothetical protein
VLGLHGTSGHLRSTIAQEGLREPYPGRGTWLVFPEDLSFAASVARSACRTHRRRQGGSWTTASGLIVTAELEGLQGYELGDQDISLLPFRRVLVIAVPGGVPRWRIRGMDEFEVRLGRPGGRLDHDEPVEGLGPGERSDTGDLARVLERGLTAQVLR